MTLLHEPGAAWRDGASLASDELDDVWTDVCPFAPVSYTHLTLPTIYSV